MLVFSYSYVTTQPDHGCEISLHTILFSVKIGIGVSDYGIIVVQSCLSCLLHLHLQLDSQKTWRLADLQLPHRFDSALSQIIALFFLFSKHHQLKKRKKHLNMSYVLCTFSSCHLKGTPFSAIWSYKAIFCTPNFPSAVFLHNV